MWRVRIEGRYVAQVGNDRCAGQSSAVRIDMECEPLGVGLEGEKRVKDPPSFLVQMDEAVTNQTGIYRHTLENSAGLGPDHHDKANITIKQVENLFAP